MTLGTVPDFVMRSPRLIDLFIRDNLNVEKWELAGQRTLDGSWAGPTTMFEVHAKADFISRGIRLRRLGVSGESNRGRSRIIFDPMDYYDGGGGAPPTLPQDHEYLYLRVREWRKGAAAWGPYGPVLILPPTGFFSSTNPTLLVSGTAPVSAGPIVPGQALDANAMHFVLPRVSDSQNMTNLDNAVNLLYSLGHDEPSNVLLAETNEYLQGTVKDMLIEGDGANVLFSFNFGIQNS